MHVNLLYTVGAALLLLNKMIYLRSYSCVRACGPGDHTMLLMYVFGAAASLYRPGANLPRAY